MKFLRNPKNKEELFSYLSTEVVAATFTQQVYITSGTEVSGNGPQMTSCWHEEADTRMVVHILHVLESDYKAIQIRSVDTDVLVIFIGKFHQILERYPDANISVALGFGKDFKIYPLNTVCEKLGVSRSRCLPLFHALTGSDTTSAFVNKGKVTA